jgi:hypothetical protein
MILDLRYWGSAARHCVILDLRSDSDHKSKVTARVLQRITAQSVRTGRAAFERFSTEGATDWRPGRALPRLSAVRPADLPRVLTPAIADICGVSRARARTEIQHGRWRQLARGVVLTRPDEPSRADWALAGLAIVGSHGALSGWDAARLVGIGSRTPPSDDVLVVTTRGGSRRAGRVWIRKVAGPLPCRMTAADDPLLPLARVVMPARAVVDNALQSARARPVRALVTTAVQRELCSVEELTAQLQYAARRNSAALRLALADAVAGARSIAEAEAAELLSVGGVPTFELNAPIVHGGRVIAVADILWRELRAVLEIDSREYHLSEAEWKATMARHNRLTKAGYAVTHYPPSAIRDGGLAWVAEVDDWLRARALELRRSSSRVILD